VGLGDHFVFHRGSWRILGTLLSDIGKARQSRAGQSGQGPAERAQVPPGAPEGAGGGVVARGPQSFA